MGIPRFFRWIGERYPCLSQVVKQYQIPDFDNLYLDVNGIIHTCSHPDDDNPHFRITEEKIFADICRYIEFLFTMIKPQKVFFIAVDGVAPRAKMNQQRGRRFKSAKAAADMEAAAQRRGEKLPDSERFDSNCITPGTEFMARLDTVLNQFIQYKVSADPNWQSVTVYYSSHSVPGEGEHKIMDYLRYQRSLPNYDPETRHCLYGLDTDLIMLGLVTHEPHFSLLREEILFKKTAKRPTCPEQTTFFLLHLRLFREYLEFEFRDLAQMHLPFGYDIEQIIDDWVLIEFLIGNDFIPHVPDCHVVSNDLPELWKIYKDVLPTLDGYLNDHGRLNLPRFQRFVQALAEFDRRKFESRFDDIKYMAGKTGGRKNRGKAAAVNELDSEEEGDQCLERSELVPSNERQLMMKQLMPFYSAEDKLLGLDDDEGLEGNGEDGAQVMPDPSDDASEDEALNDQVEEDVAFRAHKRDYYRAKMQLSGEKQMRTADFVRLQATSYIEAIEWTLRYYYEGVPSWSWFYPFHYAPYLSDMTNISDIKLDFTLGIPFHPFEQLMSVLPSASRKLLPSAYRSLMTDANSSIRHFYPEDFATDLNGKQLDWEAVVLIPFIEEQALLNAIRPLERTLSPAEFERNSFGTINAFRYLGDQGSGTIIQTGLEFIPKFTNFAGSEKLPWAKFHLKPDHVCREFPREALASLAYVPNFPTFKHLPCEPRLYAAGTSVFKMPSKNLNMIVKVSESVVPTVEAVESVAASQIGQVVLVNWPFLTEARITSIYTPSKYYTTDETDFSAADFNAIEMAHTEDSAGIYHADINYVRKYYYTTHGLDFRQSKCIVYAVTLTGVKYSENDKNQLIAVKLWSNNPQPYPYEGVIFNLKEVATEKSLLAAPPVHVMTTKLGELFPLGEQIFVVSENYFGRVGIVIGYDENRNTVKLRLRLTKQPNFEDLIRRLQAGTAGIVYNPAQQICRQANCSSFFLSRLTGCVRVKKVPRPGDNGEVVKVNVALDLKHTRDNLRMPGYTYRDEQGVWLYSDQVASLVRQYKAKFPQVFKRLQELVESNTPDPFEYVDVFGSDDNNEQLGQVRDFLTSLPTAKLTPVPNDSFILEEQLVQEVDRYVLKKTQPQFVEVYLKPDFLYRPKLTNRVNLATELFGNGNGQHFNLLDRVINIAPSHSVPLGLEGTVIGVLEEQNTSLNAYEDKPMSGDAKKITYEVMFDAEFQHGAVIRCPEKRGYRMFPQNLLGIRKVTGAVKSKPHVQNCVASKPKTDEKKEVPKNYADAVAGKPDATAFWKAVGGSDGSGAVKPEQSWPLVPANLLEAAKPKAPQNNNRNGNNRKNPESGAGNYHHHHQQQQGQAIPIPPRLLLKPQQITGAEESLKDIRATDVITPKTLSGRPGVPVIGGMAPQVSAQRNEAKDGDWEPKEIAPHDWNKIMSATGIKVTALPGPTDSPTKNIPKSASGTVTRAGGEHAASGNSHNNGNSKVPLRERQTSVSGNQFVKLFNGAPAATTTTATFQIDSSEEEISVDVGNKRTPTKSAGLPQVDDSKIRALQLDFAAIRSGKPVEFASHQPESTTSSSSPDSTPLQLSPSKGTPQRIDASQLLASVGGGGQQVAKDKQERKNYVEKLLNWALENELLIDYETNVVGEGAGGKTKFSVKVAFSGKTPRHPYPRPIEMSVVTKNENEAKRAAAKIALNQLSGHWISKMRASPRKGMNQAQQQGFVPLPILKSASQGGRINSGQMMPPPSVPMFAPPAPPPSALPIPVTTNAGVSFPQSCSTGNLLQSNNLLASLMSPKGLAKAPTVPHAFSHGQLMSHSYESPPAFAKQIQPPVANNHNNSSAKALDLNILLNKPSAPVQPAPPPPQATPASIPLSFLLPTAALRPETTTTTSSLNLEHMTISGQAGETKEEGSPPATTATTSKPRLRMAACFGAPKPVPQEGQ